jgi:hypothetical protein
LRPNLEQNHVGAVEQLAHGTQSMPQRLRIMPAAGHHFERRPGIELGIQCIFACDRRPFHEESPFCSASARGGDDRGLEQEAIHAGDLGHRQSSYQARGPNVRPLSRRMTRPQRASAMEVGDRAGDALTGARSKRCASRGR